MERRTTSGSGYQRLGRARLAVAAAVTLCSTLGSASTLPAFSQKEAPAVTRDKAVISADRPLLLTTSAEVHDLAPQLAAKARVELTGVVTYYDPGQHNLFIQDESGAVYIDTNKMYPLHYGDYVSVHGRAIASYRTEVDTNPEIRVLAHGRRVPALPVTYDKLATGQMDCRLVTIRGRVRAVNVEQHEEYPVLHLDVSMHGGEVEVYQPISAIDPEERESFVTLEALPLLDTIVEIDGAAGGDFDSKSQLTGLVVYVQQRSSIRVVKRSPVNALELPLSNIDTIFESHHVEDTSARVRLRGTLTYYKRGEAAVLEHNGKSVYVQTREDKHIPLGNIVDAVGFASDQEYAPSLKEALLFDSHVQAPITPRTVGYAEALSGIASDNLVSLEGLLVSQLRDRNVDTLVINVDGKYVTGRLDHSTPLPRLHTGSLVQITGICRVVPGGSWKAPSLFHIEMRRSSDAKVLAPPSWWTFQHLIDLLETLSVLAIVVSAWAILLRRRVRQQTKSIELAMLVAKTRSALLETINVHKTTESWMREFQQKVHDLLPGMACAFAVSGERCGLSLPAAASPQTLIHTAALHDADGHEVGVIQIFSDKSSALAGKEKDACILLTEVANLAMQQSLLHEGLVHHSTHDPLTDLPNRRLCEQRLQNALEDARDTNGRVTVVYIDVDKFKEINDRYGHRTGDSYLRHVGARLRSAIRSIDTLARVGGDEFLVIVPQKSSETDFISLRERLHSCFQQPFEVEGHCFQGSASLGMASFPEHGTTAEELKRHADQAMYSAKRMGTSTGPSRSVSQLTIPVQKALQHRAPA